MLDFLSREERKEREEMRLRRRRWTCAPGVVAPPRELRAGHAGGARKRAEDGASRRELGTVLIPLTVRRWDLSPEGAAYGMTPDSHEKAAAGTDPTDETDMTDEVRWRPGGVGSP
jgi:hypothetical protein